MNSHTVYFTTEQWIHINDTKLTPWLYTDWKFIANISTLYFSTEQWIHINDILPFLSLISCNEFQTSRPMTAAHNIIINTNCILFTDPHPPLPCLCSLFWLPFPSFRNITRSSPLMKKRCNEIVYFVLNKDLMWSSLPYLLSKRNRCLLSHMIANWMMQIIGMSGRLHRPS